jgi:hypothetical protein
MMCCCRTIRRAWAGTVKRTSEAFEMPPPQVRPTVPLDYP